MTGVLLQLGLWMINTKWVTSVANILYIVVLRVIFATAENVMHPPPSPIFNSGNYVIIGFFLTCWRILRCNPWSKGGLDPVPEMTKKSS